MTAPPAGNPGHSTCLIDGVEIEVRPGQTIVEAADEAGVWIPRLCHLPGLPPHGGCRLCTVKANGRLVAACTQPASPGAVVMSDTEELNEYRRQLIEMLFVEGNHFCMVCEKSGDCELQALAYRFGITAPRYPYLFPKRDVDASHPDILVDHDRCILCARCVRASRELDGKGVFQFVGRGPGKRVVVNADVSLTAGVEDEALDVCPVGALLRKRTGFRTPVGEREYASKPIGSDVESKLVED